MNKNIFFKPEIKKLYVQTEGFVAASNGGSTIIKPDEPDKDWTKGILEPHCTKDGVAKRLIVNEYTCFRVNDYDINSCQLFNTLGASVGQWVKVTRLDDIYFRAEIVAEQCVGGVMPSPDDIVEQTNSTFIY